MKEKVEKVFKIMSNIKPHTYVSIIMILFLIANTISVYVSGNPIIQFSEEQITDAVNIVLNILFIGFTFWQNNSVTDAALAADDILTILKDGKITRKEIEEFINKYKSENVPKE